MNYLQTVVSVVLLALCVVAVEVDNFHKCPGEDQCTIHKVSITPCREAVWTLASRSTVTLTFDYTPKFAADKLTFDAFYMINNYKWNLRPGSGMEACKYTDCPLVSGNRKTYNHVFQTDFLHPMQKTNVTLKLTSENNDSCCFIVPITIPYIFKGKKIGPL